MPKIDYEEFEREIEFINSGAAYEALDPAEAVRSSGLERQLAQLKAKKTTLESELKKIDEDIAKIEAQISQMKVS